MATFDAADAGKPVHYFFRWVNTRSEAGQWSVTVTATIGDWWENLPTAFLLFFEMIR